MGRPGAVVAVFLLAAVACAGGAGPGVDGSSPDGPSGPADSAELSEGPCGVPASLIARLAHSTDGRRLALGARDGRVAVVEPGAPSLVRVLRVTDSGAPPIALTEDGGVLAVAEPEMVTLWSVGTGQVVRRLAGAPGEVRSLKFSDAPAPLLLVAWAGATDAAAAVDNVKLWRASDGVLVGTLRGSPLATFTHADEAVLLLDQTRGGYDVVSFGGRLLRSAKFPRPLAHTAFAADGAFLAGVTAAGTGDERLAIMSVADDLFVWQASEPNAPTRQVLFLENPSRLLQLGARTLIHDHADGRVLTALPALDDASVVAATPDGAALAAIVPGGALVLVSSEDGSQRPLCPSSP